MPFPICATCGVQYAAAREDCPVCEDARQWVPPSGQAWTTLEQLRAGHTNTIRDDGGYLGIGTQPTFAIGQRALLVPSGESNVLWDCITLLDDATAAAVEARGGITAIAISHPHYYSCMVEWAHRFDCRVWLHEADRAWVMRPDPAVRFWSGETFALTDELTLIHTGGHFAGGTVMHRATGDLFSGDIVQVIPDRDWVSFMYSYPNLIPLPATAVERIVAALAAWPFTRIYGAWWDAVIPAAGAAIVERSARRYIDALNGILPSGG